MANFSEYVLSEARALVLYNWKAVNGILEESIPPYLIMQKYGKKRSPSGLWTSIMTDSSRVMTDFVARDSPFPIKKRPSLRTAMGEIPKLGGMRILNETQQKDIDRLLNNINATEEDVRQAARIMIQDINDLQFGIYETLESMVYQTLSNEGVAIYAPKNVPADLAAGAVDNVGIGIRADFGMNPLNKLNITVPWSDATNSTPITDLKNIVGTRARAAGIRIMEARTNQQTIDRLLASKEVRTGVAMMNGISVVDPTLIGTPVLEVANRYFLAELGYQFVVMDRTFQTERDAVGTIGDMWTDGAIAFMFSNTWGDVVYDHTNEALHKIPGRNYLATDDLMLLSMWDESPYNASFMHISQGQAEAIVVTDCSKLITLDTLNPAA